MNLNNHIEDRLNRLGQQLQSRPTLVEHVQRQLEAELTSIQNSGQNLSMYGNHKQYRRLAISSSLVATVAILLWIILSTSTATLAYTQVIEAVRQQKWLHAQAQFPNGEQGDMWVSLDQNLWAYRFGSSRCFYDGQQRAKYVLNESEDAINILPFSEEDKSGAFPTQTLTEESPSISWLFNTEKVVHQEQRRFHDNGREWIEFEMKLWRGEHSIAILRVDPETRLPIRMELRSAKDLVKPIVYEFDYPASGPSDIYEMGVKRELPIVDLRPSDNGQRIIDAMAASRARIGDFQMLVSTTQAFLGHAIWRRGKCWRVDLCYLMNSGGPWPSTPLEESANRSQWFEEQLGKTERVPLYICDGQTVWHNQSPLGSTKAVWERSSHVAPTDLLSGEGLGNLAGAGNIKFPSLLYPDLSRKAGWEFTFDETPEDNLGLVVIKRSARLATATPQVGHEWYFIDPKKGHAVVKAELFTVSANQQAEPDSTDLRQTVVMKDFRDATNGTWVARSIEMNMPVVSQDTKSYGQMTTTTQFDMIFDPEFKEGLFEAPTDK